MSLSEDMGTPSTGGHFGEKRVLGDMSDRWSVFQHEHKISWHCAVSFPEDNVMHGDFSPASSTGLYRNGGWHNIQVMPDLTLSMEVSILHSVSVVAVVSERQG